MIPRPQSPALALALRKLQALGPDRFELFFLRSSSTTIEAKERKIDALTRAEDVGLAVRCLRDGRMGFSYTTSLDDAAISKMVETAAETAKVMPQDPFHRLSPLAGQGYPKFDAYDSKGLALPIDAKIAAVLKLEAECRARDSRITGVRTAKVTESRSEVQLLDSDGNALEYQRTMFSLGIHCKAEEGGQATTGWDSEYSPFFERLDPDRIATRAARIATEMLGAGQAPTMSCPAVLRSEVVANLLGFLSSSFSAESIDKGRSMLAGREGKPVFAKLVTVVDDGTLEGGVGTVPFDAEGTPTMRTPVIEDGIFRQPLSDHYYAAKRGHQSTGNAGRGLTSPPGISIHNLSLVPGTPAPEQLLDGIDRGILITDLLGVHTANAVTGNFSLGASGILIENGRLTRPVRGFAVAGNILELFRATTDVANDLRFFGSVGAPSLRVAQVSVGGA